MKIKINKAQKKLYAESAMRFFINTSECFRQSTLKKMVDQFQLDHRHWLLTTAAGRRQLKIQREAAVDREHKIYLDNVARRINAHANFQREQKGLSIRPFRSHI